MGVTNSRREYQGEKTSFRRTSRDNINKKGKKDKVCFELIYYYSISQL